MDEAPRRDAAEGEERHLEQEQGLHPRPHAHPGQGQDQDGLDVTSGEQALAALGVEEGAGRRVQERPRAGGGEVIAAFAVGLVVMVALHELATRRDARDARRLLGRGPR